jgi:hypothetical protein
MKAAQTAEPILYEVVAREWYAKFSPTWTPEHGERIIRRFERDISPWLGKRPIAEINAPVLPGALRRIQARGALDTAHRAYQNCGRIFRYAVTPGRAERDPWDDPRGALPQSKTNTTAAKPATNWQDNHRTRGTRGVR